MVVPSEPKYARNGDTYIAYLTIGDGPPDVVSLGPSMSHIEVALEHPLAKRYNERIASFSRIIFYDRRGSGLSDRTIGPVTRHTASSNTGLRFRTPTISRYSVSKLAAMRSQPSTRFRERFRLSRSLDL